MWTEWCDEFHNMWIPTLIYICERRCYSATSYYKTIFTSYFKTIFTFCNLDVFLFLIYIVNNNADV